MGLDICNDARAPQNHRTVAQAGAHAVRSSSNMSSETAPPYAPPSASTVHAEAGHLDAQPPPVAAAEAAHVDAQPPPVAAAEAPAAAAEAAHVDAQPPPVAAAEAPAAAAEAAHVDAQPPPVAAAEAPAAAAEAAHVDAQPPGNDLYRSLLDIVKTRFGFSRFRPLQADIMIALMRGNDVTAFMPTSAGKSLCFQVPALLAKRPVVVCSPLLSLIQDQVDSLNAKAKAAGFPNCAVSLAGAHHSEANERAAMDGKYDMIYVTPERLVMDAFIAKLRSLHECTGYNFRPDMMQIGKLRLQVPEIPIACFTATATQAVKKDLASVLHLRSPSVFSLSQDRPNLCMRVAQVYSKNEGLDLVAAECGDARDGSHVVFTFTRKDAEMFGSELRKRLSGKSVLSYHGMLEMEQRLHIQKKFMHNEVDIVCATGSSFGTGVDKGDVRKVIIYGAPKSMEEFVQQVGRGGRDGQRYEAVLVYTAASFAVHWSQQKKEAAELPPPTARARRSSLWSLQNFCRSTSCRRLSLLGFWNESPEWDKCMQCDNCNGTTYKSPCPRPADNKGRARKRPGSSGSLFTQQKKFNP